MGSVLGAPDPQETASSRARGTAVLLVARSAFAAAPHAEMERIAALVASLSDIAAVAPCYSEQGNPSFREALLALRERAPAAILIVPLHVPVEPSFRSRVARSLKRWQAEDPGNWPPIRIAPDLARSPLFGAILAGQLESAAAEPAIPPHAAASPEGSLVPPQKRRVLVCEGLSCSNAGADAIWGHLRNVQERRGLRLAGDGTMTAKATCLGPCSLAPVVQVFPEGTYYGGVTEAAIDRIAEEHLLGGCIVEAFAYHPTGRKQRLRQPQTRS